MKSSKLIAVASGFMLLFATLTPGGIHDTASANTAEAIVLINSYEQHMNGQLSYFGSGSGSIINDNGLVLTNAHVIGYDEPLDAFTVCLTDDPDESPDCQYTATPVAFDADIDLALLQINNTPIFGDAPNSFPFLDFSDQTLEIGDQLSVAGFPVHGGETFTKTMGTVIGKNTINNYSYVNTDATTDAGNSGGPALNESNEILGVVTFSSQGFYDSSGLFLEGNEVQNWLDNTEQTDAYQNTFARDELAEQELRLHNAEANGALVYEDHFFDFSIPVFEDWTVYYADDTDFYMQRDDGKGSISGEIGFDIFTIGDSGDPLQDDLDEMLEYLDTDFYTEYFELEIDGEEALGFVQGGEEGEEGPWSVIYVTRGDRYLLLELYQEDYPEAEDEGIQLFNEFEINSTANDPLPRGEMLDDDNYPFAVEMPNDWRVAKAFSADRYLATAEKDSDYNETVTISHWERPEDTAASTAEEGLEYDKNYSIGYMEELVFETPIVVDGLTGWLYVTEYDDIYDADSAKKVIISASINDPASDEHRGNEIYFYYEGDAVALENGTAYDEMVEMLESYQSKRYDEYADKTGWDDFFSPDNQATYNIPAFTPVEKVTLSDIEGHRYQDDIEALIELGSVSGYPDGTYQPERIVERGEALAVIYRTLNILKQQYEGDDYQPYIVPDSVDGIPDVTEDKWYRPYAFEAYENDVIDGYPQEGGKFLAGRQVKLAEYLKMMLLAFESDVYEQETDPWYKRYMDEAFELYLLPEGVDDPGRGLTRGEVAAITNAIIWYYPFGN